MSNLDQSRGQYCAAGVDEEREQLVFRRAMLPLLQALKIRSDRVESLAGVASGHFATVLRIDKGPAIAITTDGVGTKLLVARMANRYYPVGVDCVANNVNDLLCIGAEPVALLDYIATDEIHETVLGELARGLADGATEAGIAIPGGEIAQMGSMIAGSAKYGSGPSIDIVGTAVGLLRNGDDGEPLMLDGSAAVGGDIVLGLASSGLHSNGFSLARDALFERSSYDLSDEVPGTHRTVGDALLEPTKIYVKAIMNVWDEGLKIHGLVNISGGGLLNLLRLPAKVGYVLDDLPAVPPIFPFIQQAGSIPDEEMYSTFNMGIGACLLVPPTLESAVTDVLTASGEVVYRLGRVTDDGPGTVSLPTLGLRGRGDVFTKV